MTDCTMKRSTPGEMLVTPADFELAMKGVKTATTRLGDRREVWPVGATIWLVDNENPSNRLSIIITYNVAMTLGEINDRHAQTISGYDRLAHWDDFCSVYPGSDIDTSLSLVGFFAP